MGPFGKHNGSTIYGFASGGMAGPRGPLVTSFTEDDLRLLLTIQARRGPFQTQTFSLNAAEAKQLRPSEARSYFFIINQSAGVLNQVLLGIGRRPGNFGTIPPDGLLLAARGGFFEPLAVPDNEIWVRGAAAGTVGYMAWQS